MSPGFVTLLTIAVALVSVVVGWCLMAGGLLLRDILRARREAPPPRHARRVEPPADDERST